SAVGVDFGAYTVPDTSMAAGSTLGGPKTCMVIKATGAIEKIYAIDAGEAVFGALVVHFWDERTGIRLQPLPGSFALHPERQEHHYTLPNDVAIHETLFVLSG